ncbi:MAG: hypothetical protein PVH95_00345 [Anaerolineae bacterium]|jgi:hypothetical protein
MMDWLQRDRAWTTKQLRAKASGTYESTVTDVSMSGWTYTAGANQTSGATLDVP